MGLAFNANEIFEMAEQIERNGARFYRKAAERTKDEAGRRIFNDLAEMEDKHLATFKEMQKRLAAGDAAATTFDPDNQAAMYLQAMADRRVFDVTVDPSEQLTGKEPAADILHTAIGLEKDSIVFYLGMRDLVPERLGKGKIEDIIREEMEHIAILSSELAKVK
jgi:rubrerythrin